MTDLPTLEAALKLADQDSPLPSLAGPALKVLRDRLLERNADVAQLNKELARLSCLFHNVGPCPVCGSDHAESLRSYSVNDGKMFRCAACGHTAGCKRWPQNPSAQRHTEGANDSATLAALIAELRAREAVGRAKYGTAVDRTDLTNTQWRQHLREELMDALLYSLAEERTAPAATDFTKLSPEGKAAWGSAVRDHIAAQTPKVGEAKERAQPMEEVECGGCAPAVAASPAKSTPYSLNSGYGHVRARPDGLVARCGGPMLCRIYAKELADMFEIPGDDKCWCSTCRPITLTDMRMVLCPICGNKRCPHAHDHRNACTGSNAVGQPGSSWEHVKPITQDEQP